MTFRTWTVARESRSWNRQLEHGPTRPRGRKLAFETLEGRALPAFLAPVEYDTGAYPYAAAVADLNGDGDLDLAVANYSDSTVSVLLGNGDGTFQEPANSSATGAYPLSIAVGDFNDDGTLDLATANAYDVSVMMGNGDGSFGEPASLSVVGYPQSVAVGDFNGDGSLDLGVTSNDVYYDYYYYGTNYYGYANVLIGNGDGTFSGPNSTWLDYGYHTSAAATDLDGDEYDDFVSVNADYGYVEALRGDSSGYLQGPSYYYTGYNSTAVTAGDLDGDGDNDLVTANAYSNSVSVLLGDGTGGFSSAQTYATDTNATTVALGDFTGDGNVDIAVASYDSANVSVLHGLGAGTFSNPEHAPAGSYPWAIATGDFDGDTWLDAVTTNTGSNTVSVLLNDQNWPSPPPPSVSINNTSVTETDVGTINAVFTLTLSSISASDVTVSYNTADLAAEAGLDYVASSGEVTIPAGTTSRTFTIPVMGDYLAELTESFAVNLSDPVNATIGDGQGVGTIFDDEPLISINNVSVTEGNTGSVNASFTVSLSSVSDVPVTVQFNTANGTAVSGSDFAAASGTVTIPANQLSTTVTVAVLGDRIAESAETFSVTLSSPVNAGISDSQGVGTIVDNEPRITINDLSKKEGNGGTTKFVFTVSLLVPHDQPVTVNFATADGSAIAGVDYVAKSGSVTFAPGVMTQTITINAITEKLKESNETFFLNLSGASVNALIIDAQGIGTILDDDNR